MKNDLQKYQRRVFLTQLASTLVGLIGVGAVVLFFDPAYAVHQRTLVTIIVLAWVLSLALAASVALHKRPPRP